MRGDTEQVEKLLCALGWTCTIYQQTKARSLREKEAEVSILHETNLSPLLYLRGPHSMSWCNASLTFMPTSTLCIPFWTKQDHQHSCRPANSAFTHVPCSMFPFPAAGRFIHSPVTQGKRKARPRCHLCDTEGRAGVNTCVENKEQALQIRSQKHASCAWYHQNFSRVKGISSRRHEGLPSKVVHSWSSPGSESGSQREAGWLLLCNIGR